MNTKAILLATAVAVGSSMYFGKKKIGGYMAVLEQMDFNIKGVKNLKLQGSHLAFDIDIELVNPTNIAVQIPGDRITVRNLHFFTATGKRLGYATPNIADISMPANGSRIITNIPAVFDLVAIGSSFSEAVEIALSPETMLVAADLVAFGQSFTVTS